MAKSILLNFRVTPEEYLRLQTISQFFAGGNLSAWILQRCLKEDGELSTDLSLFLADENRKSKALGEEK